MFEPSNLTRASAPEASSEQALRILLAEDTQISAETMKAMASHLAVELDTVDNGLDAIHMVEAAQAEGKPYALLLTDVMMPILDGVETTKRLRELGFGPDILPIVAVTAATSFDEIRSYRAAGFQAFLAKPVGLKELQATLDAWSHRKPPRISARQLDTFRHLAEQFSERNAQTLQIIDDALGQPEIEASAVIEIRHLLHQIAGTATSFGNPQLGEAARFYENALLEPQPDMGSLRTLLEDVRQNMRKRIDS